MEKLNWTHIKSLGNLNCSEVYLRNGEKDVVLMSLKAAEKELGGLRLHRSTIVNPEAISEVDVEEDGKVFLIMGEHRVKVARARVGILFKHITGNVPKYKRRDIIKKHYGYSLEQEP